MAAAAAAGANATASVPPNQSLYLQNLNEKLQKYDLQRALYMLFSTYGPVIDITAVKTKKMRGQAHVLFRDVHTATQAMRHCQGMEFFGREMKISYARSRSQTLAKLTGISVESATAAADQTKAAQQQTSLPLPPGTAPSRAPPSSLPPPPGLPTKVNGLSAIPPATTTLQAPTAAPAAPASPSGVKRAREESEGEDDDAPMEEDSGGEMDMSDDED